MKWAVTPDWVKPLATSIVAQREDVSIRTVEDWCDFGLVPAKRTPGKRWRIARNYRECIGGLE